jgi:diguanylate cyclase (GGDEF)-like protein
LASTLEQATKSGDNFAVLCIDLDRFKEVNDIFGHARGDSLLREVSRRLQDAVGGAFLARLGGDEFIVVLADGTQPSSAEALGDRLLAAIADELEIDGQGIRIGLSVGVAIFPSDGDDALTLIGNADAALYRAKAQGRGTICFFEADMDKRLRERRALQHDLSSALARNELVLHYQPQARIGGEITGFEALVRWQHPVRGVIPPNKFIPIAEESGLIISLGEWILREACREAASWPNKLQIAVNLSPIQFRHGDLPGLVLQTLLETGLSSDRLELEITEGVLIGDFARAVSILRRLKDLGVRIAMDDFGTGYSSLSYLQAFPFDKIKIDRAFIANLDSNPQSAAIIRAVIGLGRGLDLPVIAEGVETDEQLAFLRRESCDEVQGFLVGRPYTIESYDAVTGRQTAVVAPKIRRAG